MYCKGEMSERPLMRRDDNIVAFVLHHLKTSRGTGMYYSGLPYVVFVFICTCRVSEEVKKTVLHLFLPLAS